MSSITDAIINAISDVLIAFVAISLVVSSIMIGIITYISVLERTKEIGILRARSAPPAATRPTSSTRKRCWWASSPARWASALRRCSTRSST